MLAKFRSELGAFLDRVSLLAQERGFAPPSERLRDPLADLRYLVRYQVVRENATEIARSESRADPEGAGRHTVMAAVRRAAEVVGLTLRERDPGARGSRRKGTPENLL
jgi:hypothetical protein